MRNSFDSHRRKFLRYSVLAGLGAGAVGCGREPSPWRTLTAREGRTLLALCDRIIPPDQAPGAADCGVVTYIDRQLGAHYAEFRQLYARGLAALDASAAEMGGAAFADLPAEKQDELLRLIEKDSPPGEAWKGVPARQFFLMVVDHSMQGYYGDPRHGGNRGLAAWKMIGVPSTPVRGRMHIDLREVARR